MTAHEGSPPPASFDETMRDRLLARARGLEAGSRCRAGRWLVRAYGLGFARERIRRLAVRWEGGATFSRTLREIYERHEGIEIGAYSIGTGIRPELMARGTRIGNYSVIDSAEIFRRNHPIERISQHPFFYNQELGILDEDTIESVGDNPLTIGHDVHMGANSWVVPSCRSIGDGAVVEPGAVVTRDVEPYTIVGGNPARVVGRRFDEETVARIRESRWFLLPITKLVENFDFFVNPATEELLGRFLKDMNAESGELADSA